MDHDRFDALTRTLATTTSRRSVFKTLTVGVVGSLFGLTGARRAGAAADEKDAARCLEKAQELAAECALLDDEKEAERCAERRAELCEECPETCGGPTQNFFACLCHDGTTPSTCNSNTCDEA